MMDASPAHKILHVGRDAAVGAVGLADKALLHFDASAPLSTSACLSEKERL
jgi:hypothetical protein